ncbi:MAG TPA: ABC transporter substrate-binding protein, partial [Ktedonobacterales bacterium]|nr:ABC transporter substrate-binding protein [Ktedonobacterales bacterium]
KMAMAEINKKGGILGRPLQIIAEDSAAKVGQATEKLDRLVEQDKVDFTAGGVSSAGAAAMSHAAHLKKILYIAVGGHVDTITGTNCYWNTFKLCSDTWMLSEALCATLLKKFGKRWYFCTPDYAWGHFLYKGASKILADNHGTNLGNAVLPLGATDFTSALIKVKQAKPDVFVVFQSGDDFVNLMKQAAQFGMTTQMAFASPLLELEPLASLPEAARTGWGVMEWWWDQPKQPHVKEFVDAYRKLYKATPSGRSWLGFAATHSLALAAARAKSIDSLKMAKAMEGMVLPPEVALEPFNPTYRAADHQCLITEFVGEVNQKGTYPNLFTVSEELPGAKLAATPEAKGCHMEYPA